MSALIATLALLFTIGSFWWLNARRGKVVTFTPGSFTAEFSKGKIILILPLVLLNNGAAPIVVKDLRLRLTKSRSQARREKKRIKPGEVFEKPQELVMRLRGVHSSLTDSPTPPQLPTVLAIAGRKTESMIAEFGVANSGNLPNDGPCRVTIEGRFGHQRFRPGRWRRVAVFDLLLDRVKIEGQRVAVSNDPHWRP